MVKSGALSPTETLIAPPLLSLVAGLAPRVAPAGRSAGRTRRGRERRQEPYPRRAGRSQPRRRSAPGWRRPDRRDRPARARRRTAVPAGRAGGAARRAPRSALAPPAVAG